jgi:hypothetical protein
MRWLIAYPAWRVVRPLIVDERPFAFWATCGVAFIDRSSLTKSSASSALSAPNGIACGRSARGLDPVQRRDPLRMPVGLRSPRRRPTGRSGSPSAQCNEAELRLNSDPDRSSSPRMIRPPNRHAETESHRDSNGQTLFQHPAKAADYCIGGPIVVMSATIADGLSSRYRWEIGRLGRAAADNRLRARIPRECRKGNRIAMVGDGRNAVLPNHPCWSAERVG